MVPIKYAIAIISCVLFFSAIPTHSAEQTLTQQNEIAFWADHASFHCPDSLVYQEIYVQLLCRDFAFHEIDNKYQATYQLEMTLRDENDSPVPIYTSGETPAQKRVWEKQLFIASDQNISDQVAVETFPFHTSPGNYQLYLTVTDKTTNKTATLYKKIEVPLPKPNFRISDIELAHRIDQTDTPGKIIKNGYYVVPNVTRTLTPDTHTLLFYFELYGLSDGPTNAFDLSYAIRDTNDTPIKIFSSTRYKKPGPSCAKTETLQLPELPSGSYSLSITARDADTRQLALKSLAFYVSPPNQPTLATDDASLKRYFEHIRYLAKKSDRETYNTLSPEEKVTFILNFWKERDPSPNTPENEFAAEHFQRLKYADDNFPKRPRQKGSDTDKGRVYILYGPPTDIERFPFSAIGKPYEIWTYETSNRYQFVFLDRLGDGVYELIHATMPGERYNPNWEEDQTIGDPADPMAPPPDAFNNN